MALARQLLRAGSVPEEKLASATTEIVARSIFSSNVQSQPEGQRIGKRKFRLLSASESDTLVPEQKETLVAIAGSADLAAPLPEADQTMNSPIIRLLIDKTVVSFTRVSETKVAISVIRDRERTLQTSFTAPIDLVERAFFSAPLPEEKWTPSLRAGLTNEYGTRLPARFVESFATLLQDSVRLQALLHGALPPGVSRALYVHGAQLRRNETGEPSRRKTYVVFPLHKSCLPESGCICAVLHPGCFPRKSRPLSVKVEHSFCGQRRVRVAGVEEPHGNEVEGSRYCPNHRNAPKVSDGVFDLHCLCNHELAITCVHENKAETKTRMITIPPTALGAALTMASASCLFCEDSAELDAQSVHVKTETAVEEAEAARMELKGRATPTKDRQVSEAFRSGQTLFAPYSQIFARGKGR